MTSEVHNTARGDINKHLLKFKVCSLLCSRHQGFISFNLDLMRRKQVRLMCPFHRLENQDWEVREHACGCAMARTWQSPQGWTQLATLAMFPPWGLHAAGGTSGEADSRTRRVMSKIRNKTRMPTLTTTIQHSFRRPSHSNQRRKRNKQNPIWKRSSKTLTVCTWHDPLCRKP